MRYTIELSYAGAGFCGWQNQPDAPSVQQCLEHALGTLLGTPTPVIGAGRTDAGVNAIAYIACFDGPEDLEADIFCYKLNAILPASVAVASVSPACPDFHARFDARRREYTYLLHRVKDPFVAGYSYYFGYPAFDVDAMNRAAAMLVGTHDFSCFEKTGADNKTSVCTVFEAFWAPYTPTHVRLMGSVAPSVPVTGMHSNTTVDSAVACASAFGKAMPVQGNPCGPMTGPLPFADGKAGMDSQYWYFRIAADRFLRNMVRAIVGTLLEIGRGKRTPADFATLILPPDTPQSSGAASASDSDAFISGARTSGSGNISPNAGAARQPRTTRRSLAGQSVPAHALFLSKVEY
ncbi:MAG: tRNA pseudouridine synthase A [Bacteroidales bacterium]|nr:tRNA pseudouridine synthase A [Bacteroidales bacterium]